METIAVLGDEEFILGFMLTGIRNCIKVDEQAAEHQAVEQINKIREQADIGVMVIQQELYNKLPLALKDDLIRQVKPAVVLLSKSGESEKMRQMIIKSIGIDLWHD